MGRAATPRPAGCRLGSPQTRRPPRPPPAWVWAPRLRPGGGSPPVARGRGAVAAQPAWPLCGSAVGRGSPAGARTAWGLTAPGAERGAPPSAVRSGLRRPPARLTSPHLSTGLKKSPLARTDARGVGSARRGGAGAERSVAAAEARRRRCRAAVVPEGPTPRPLRGTERPVSGPRGPAGALTEPAAGPRGPGAHAAPPTWARSDPSALVGDSAAAAVTLCVAK